MINLPDPSQSCGGQFFEALNSRRSVRAFKPSSLELTQVSFLLWVTQGVVRGGRRQRRTVPSAGATYPLEAYLVCGSECVSGLEAGIYRYIPEKHSIEQTRQGDIRSELARACFRQEFIADAPVSIVIAADYSRTTGHYGERGVRYVHIEVGHAGQNIYLACEVAGLATVAVGAFDDEAVARVMGLSIPIEPVYVMPIGYKR